MLPEGLVDRPRRVLAEAYLAVGAMLQFLLFTQREKAAERRGGALCDFRYCGLPHDVVCLAAAKVETRGEGRRFLRLEAWQLVLLCASSALLSLGML